MRAADGVHAPPVQQHAGQLAQLTAMGYGETVAVNALADSGGDVARAIARLSRPPEPQPRASPGQPSRPPRQARQDAGEAALARIVAMGYGEHDAAEALAHCNGDAQRAVARLLVLNQ